MFYFSKECSHFEEPSDLLLEEVTSHFSLLFFHIKKKENIQI